MQWPVHDGALPGQTTTTPWDRTTRSFQESRYCNRQFYRKGAACPDYFSERAKERAEADNGGKGDQGSDNADRDDVAIAFPMCRSADGEQRDHRTVVRQAVERARPDDRDTMEQCGIQ